MSGAKYSSGPQDGGAEAGRSVARSGENSLIEKVLELIRSHPGNAPKRQLLAKVEALRGEEEAPSELVLGFEERMIVAMLAELHSNVAEAERPMAMMDLSDDQAARARTAVRRVAAIALESLSAAVVIEGAALDPEILASLASARPGPLKIYDSLRTVLLRPDVGEAIAKGLCAYFHGNWAEATEGGRNAYRADAERLIKEALAAPRESPPPIDPPEGVDPSRATGRTASRLAATPDRATFIVAHGPLVGYCRMILRSHGRRSDAVRIITAEQANMDGIRGVDQPVHLDHDCAHLLSAETLERICVINERHRS